jgi:hypothetical protein
LVRADQAGIMGGLLQMNIDVNDDVRQNYYVAITTLKPGDTIADLQAVPSSDVNLPSFVHLVLIDFELTNSHTHEKVYVDNGPLDFSCMVTGPGQPKGVAHFGPVEVVP